MRGETVIAGPAHPAGTWRPPLILLVEDTLETLELYSRPFKRAGVWLESVTTAEEALAVVKHLHPVAIVTGTGSAAGAGGTSVVNALKQDPAATDIPLIVLTSGSTHDVSPGTHRAADLVLAAPVSPETLLDRIREVITWAHDVRRSAAANAQHSRRLVARSQALVEQSLALTEAISATQRRCPSCREPLDHVEPRPLLDAQYDHYHWCRNGCGLYCYSRLNDQWVKLA